jgi:hypothetical protein
VQEVHQEKPNIEKKPFILRYSEKLYILCECQSNQSEPSGELIDIKVKYICQIIRYRINLK